MFCLGHQLKTALWYSVVLSKNKQWLLPYILTSNFTYCTVYLFWNELPIPRIPPKCQSIFLLNASALHLLLSPLKLFLPFPIFYLSSDFLSSSPSVIPLKRTCSSPSDIYLQMPFAHSHLLSVFSLYHPFAHAPPPSPRQCPMHFSKRHLATNARKHPANILYTFWYLIFFYVLYISRSLFL